MNQEIKTKWVVALRSGDYKQTKGKLKDANGYCCLGVLCDISRKETGFGIEHNEAREILGETIRKWSGLTFCSGDRVTIDDIKTSLADHNDDGATFLQIADAIEAQL